MQKTPPALEIRADLAPSPFALTIPTGGATVLCGLPDKLARKIAGAAMGLGVPRRWEAARKGEDLDRKRSPAHLARSAYLGPDCALGSLRPKEAIAEAAALFGVDPAAPRVREELSNRGWNEPKRLSSYGADALLEFWLARERTPELLVTRGFVGRLPLVEARGAFSDWLAETTERGGAVLLLESDPAPLLALRRENIGAFYTFRDGSLAKTDTLEGAAERTV